MGAVLGCIVVRNCDVQYMRAVCSTCQFKNSSLPSACGRYGARVSAATSPGVGTTWIVRKSSQSLSWRPPGQLATASGLQLSFPACLAWFISSTHADFAPLKVSQFLLLRLTFCLLSIMCRPCRTRISCDDMTRKGSLRVSLLDQARAPTAIRLFAIDRVRVDWNRVLVNRSPLLVSAARFSYSEILQHDSVEA